MNETAAIATAAAASSGVTITALGFLLRYWFNHVNRALKENTHAINELTLKLETKVARDGGKEELLWAEIRHLRDKSTTIENRVDKAWKVVHKLESNRLSDDILGR